MSDNKTPAQIAELACSDAAGRAQLVKVLAEALAAGELVPECELRSLNDFEGIEYEGVTPAFNPRKAVGGARDPRAPDKVLGDGFISWTNDRTFVVSDFEVPISRAAFHAWRERTTRVHLADSLFTLWPRPRSAKRPGTKELAARASEISKQHGISKAAARRQLAAEFGVSAGSIKTAASRSKPEKNAPAPAAPGERRLRVVTKRAAPQGD